MTNCFLNLRDTEDDSACQDVVEWDGAVGSSMGGVPQQRKPGERGTFPRSPGFPCSIDFTIAASPVASIGLRFRVSVRPSEDLQQA